MVGEVRRERPVTVYLLDGTIEGRLLVSERLRTLDDMNVVSKRFVTVYSPRVVHGDWPVAESSLSLNKASILLLHENMPPQPQAGGRFGNFSRAALRLRVSDFTVQGFVHVPPGGEPMKRLDQGNHPFVALTSALVSRSGVEFTTPFLAVNRDHIVAAQHVDAEEAEVAESEAVATTEG